MPVDVLEGNQCADNGLIRVHNIQELHKAPEEQPNLQLPGKIYLYPGYL